MKKINLILILSCMSMIFSCSNKDEENNLDVLKHKKTEVSTEAIKLASMNHEGIIDLNFTQGFLIKKFNEINSDYQLLMCDIIEDSILNSDSVMIERPSLVFYIYDKATEMYLTTGCSLIKVLNEYGILDYYLDPNDVGDTGICKVSGNTYEFVVSCVKKNSCKKCSLPYPNKDTREYNCSKKECGGSGYCAVDISTHRAQPQVTNACFDIGNFEL